MSYACISGNGGSRLIIRVGREGPPGPQGPLAPVAQQVDMTSVGTEPILLLAMPALPAGIVGMQIVSGFVIAQDQTTGAVIVWQLLAAMRLNPDGSVSWPGATDGSQATNPQVTTLIADSAMAACTLVPELGAAQQMLIGTGVGSNNIRWTSSLAVTGNFS